MRTTNLRLIVTGFLMVLGSFAAQAVPLTYNFSGTVTNSFNPGQFAVGSAFNGTFSYDTAATDLNASNAVGDYASGFSITTTVGGITYNNQTGFGRTIIWNNNVARDRFDAVVQGTAGTGNGHVDASNALAGFMPFILRAVFDDLTQTAFSGDALPTVPLNIGAFAADVFQLSFYDVNFNQRDVIGNITSLQLVPNGSSVPEPGTTALMILGLGALGTLVRRRKA